MRKTVCLALLLTAFVWLTEVSNTYAARPTLAEKIGEQQGQLDKETASGLLKPQEAAVLQENLDWIKLRSERISSNGMLAPDKRVALEKALEKNGKMILNKKDKPIESVSGYALQDRMHEQQNGIQQGIRSSQFTHKETAAVQDNLSWIKSRQARLSAAGRFTGTERDEIERMLDENSAMIYKEKEKVIKRLY